MAARRRRRRTASSGWTEAHVRRLFWRAGFGATPAEARRWAARGRAATLKWVVDGGRGPQLRGSAPTVSGKRLDPANEYGHDVLWWLDRMVRSQRPLVEKMTLFWHDHFATADQDTPLMLGQNQTLRRGGLGSFRSLLGAVTRDPAMQLFLSLADSDKQAPNENYARELMELFTLGSGYSERDIREVARALTGWESRYANDHFQGLLFNPESHDPGVKRIFGRSGRFGTDDVLDLVVAHPKHAPFLVTKLWSFFVSEPPRRATVRGLAALYRRSGLRIKPVLRAILSHPSLYRSLDAPDMVKAPVVLVAGALRATGQGVQTDDWTWLLSTMGQTLFSPPSVAGWEWGPAWMSSNSMRARFDFANVMLDQPRLKVPEDSGDPRLAAADQLRRASGATGEPWVSGRTRDALMSLATGTYGDLKADDDQGRRSRATLLERSLRHLMLAGPDAQLH
jgi:uncharacterized protein (DUF1800 family)